MNGLCCFPYVTNLALSNSANFDFLIQFVNILVRLLDLGLQMAFACHVRGHISNQVLGDRTMVFFTDWTEDKKKKIRCCNSPKTGVSVVTPSSWLQKK